MKRTNKITNYFKSNKVKMNNKENRSADNSKLTCSSSMKNDADSDSDCIIIDDISPQKKTLQNKISNESGPSKVLKSNESNESRILYDAESAIDTKTQEENHGILVDDGLDEKFLQIPEDGVMKYEDNSIVQGIVKSDYVKDFFMQMVNDFLSRHTLHYLFSDQELNLIKSFVGLNPELQTLFSHLYWLQWKWQRGEIITKYVHLGNYKSEAVKCILKALEHEGFLLNGDKMNLDDWLTVLNITQLNKIAKNLPKNLFTKKSSSPTKPKKEFIVNILKKICSGKTDISKCFVKANSKTKCKVLSAEEKLLKKMCAVFGSHFKITNLAKVTFDMLHSIMYAGINPQILREKRLMLLLLNVRHGKQCYPAMEFECDTPDCIFPQRIHFLKYFQANRLFEEMLMLTTASGVKNSKLIIEKTRKCYDLYMESTKSEIINDWIPPPWLRRFTPQHQYIKAMELGLGIFKSSRSNALDEEALRLLMVLLDQTHYRQHKRALWYSEQALILDTRLKDKNQAAEILILALNEPDMSDDEKAPLKIRAQRISKNTCLDPEVANLLKDASKFEEHNFPSIQIPAKAVEDNAPGRKARYYFDNDAGERTYSSVEDYALLHYLMNFGYDFGDHWEGRIILNLFALLFWDIIYSTVKKGIGIFLCPYQDSPLDMNTKYFYENRKPLVDERLQFIKTSNMEDITAKMKSTLDMRKTGEISVLSDKIDWDTMLIISECLGQKGLHCICKRLAEDYHYSHSGFPDLTVWNSKTKKIKFVEVKGDGDKLSCKQIQWMQYLLDSKIETEVCYVVKNTVKSAVKRAPTASKKSAVNTPVEVKPENSKINQAKPDPDMIDFIEESFKTHTNGISKTKNDSAKHKDISLYQSFVNLDNNSLGNLSIDKLAEKINVKLNSLNNVTSVKTPENSSSHKLNSSNTLPVDNTKEMVSCDNNPMSDDSDCFIMDEPSNNNKTISSSIQIVDLTSGSANTSSAKLSMLEKRKSEFPDDVKDYFSSGNGTFFVSPNKMSGGGVGYLPSPSKSSIISPSNYLLCSSPTKSTFTPNSANNSPKSSYKKRKASLSLVRRKLMDIDN